MSHKATILVVEDDPAMRSGLADNFEIEGYQVIAAGTVREGREAAVRRHPDLVLIDVMLPDGSGFDLCRTLRAQGFARPILMLTARGEELDRVLGLETGADDYIVKPFSLRELLARIRAHLRRERVAAVPAGTVRVGVAEADFARHRLLRDGQELEVSAKEMELLRYFVTHRGEALSRDTLLADVWGHPDDVVTRTVDNFVVRLRKKIEADAGRPRHLLTVHGVGYKLVEQD